MGLLEPTYDVPGGGDSTFMRLQKGENRFRFLGKPVMGYQYWQDDKCIRIKEASEAPTGEKPQHFWEMPVWCDNMVKVLSITQKTVQKALKDLDGNSEWGNLATYDVIVNRTGDGMETSYTTTPCPKSQLEDVAKQAYAEFKKDYKPEAIFDVENSDDEDDDLPF
jgi:hypothetical protein|tara:strand:- start:2567 stop:3061 length:495 start_codon:yes stop_codon:yes gene_type:complete